MSAAVLLAVVALGAMVAGCAERRSVQAVWTMPRMPVDGPPMEGQATLLPGSPLAYAHATGSDVVYSDPGEPVERAYLTDAALDQRAATTLWRSDERAALREAAVTGRGLLVDFTASWCTPCMRMQYETLRDPEVLLQLSTYFVPVRIDVTEDNAVNREQVARYGVAQLPAILLLDAKRNELDRVDEHLDVVAFLQRLRAARSKM